MLTTGRRFHARTLYAAAVASLFLISLFLWRSADSRFASSVDGTVNVKLTPSGGYNGLSDALSSNGEIDDYRDHDEEKAAQLEDSNGIARPFSVSLPPPSTTSESEPEKHVAPSHAPSHAPAKDVPPPPPPGKPATVVPEKQRISDKPDNLTISGFVFYGRRDRVESMHCYLERNLVTNGGWLDNVIWVVNTNDVGDLTYLEQILDRSPLYLTHILEEPVGWPNYSKIWRMVDRDTMYIKIDDDIVWMADDAIERIVTTKLERRDALAVSANVINSPPLSFLHYHMGALHPYFPDLPANFDLNRLIPPPEPEEEEEEEKEEEKKESDSSEGASDPVQQQSEDKYYEDEKPSNLTKRFASFNHRSPWRSSAHPFWKGSDDFEWDLDYIPPPFPNHRWLRIQDDKAINRTPVAELTYDMWGPTYESWAIAAQQHYSLLENIEYDQLDLYKFDKPWDMKGERIRINFLAILGSDILDTDVFNWPDDQGDEDMIVLRLPHDTGRPILVEGTALGAHFNFAHQSGVSNTDLLARYRSLAGEKACLTPSPPAF